jgi:adenylyltransferase/sulfurtransferase
MDKYFDRQIQLWGEQTQNNLQNKHILIVGSGGLGSSLAIALGSSGIGKITLIDFDTVAIHNIHRQIAFTMSDIDKNKADVLKDVLESRCPYVQVTSYNISFEEYTKLNSTPKIDLILDATDNLIVRDEIDKYAKKQNTPWIYGSVEQFHGQVCFFDKVKFSSIMNIQQRVPEGITTAIVMQIASFQANLAIRYLTDLSVKKDLLYYMFFSEDGQMMLNQFKLPS